MKLNAWKIKYICYEKWQQKHLLLWLSILFIFFTSYIFYTCYVLYKDKSNEEIYWNNYLYEHDTLSLAEKQLSENATKVLTGTYIDNIKEVNIKESTYKVKFQLWFKWKNNSKLNMLENYEIYNGDIDSQEIIKDVKMGDVNYQLAEVTATISKVFWTKRFPIGSYQLRFYIEPKQGIENILIKPDIKNSSINKNINISGFSLNNFATNLCIQTKENTKADPSIKAKVYKTSEFMTAIELKREGIGLYVKCFIALIGTLGWVLIALFICTYHNVDPLSMIPSALFGTVSNILVGANLVPDALDTGLLEYVNIFGIFIILIATLSIIMINRIRDYHEDKSYASFFGKHIFWLLLIMTFLGNLLLPIAAYKF